MDNTIDLQKEDVIRELEIELENYFKAKYPQVEENEMYEWLDDHSGAFISQRKYDELIEKYQNKNLMDVLFRMYFKI